MFYPLIKVYAMLFCTTLFSEKGILHFMPYTFPLHFMQKGNLHLITYTLPQHFMQKGILHFIPYTFPLHFMQKGILHFMPYTLPQHFMLYTFPKIKCKPHFLPTTLLFPPNTICIYIMYISPM